MPVVAPTSDQLKQIADEIGLSLDDTDLASFIALMAPSVGAYNAIDQLPDNLPPVRYPRDAGRRPSREENRYNAWYCKTDVRGARSGKLKGRTVVVKDNVMLAGVPMMNGASTLEGYVPEVDATVVTRILDAGGTIVGKSHCEYFCASGGSHTNATGPVHNPHRMGYSAGGSSSSLPSSQRTDAPFDVSHHPAMKVPCAMSEGLPVSMMLVGKHFYEPTRLPHRLRVRTG